MRRWAMLLALAPLIGGAGGVPDNPPSAQDAEWAARICDAHTTTKYESGMVPWSKIKVTHVYDTGYEDCAKIRPPPKAWKDRWESETKQFFQTYIFELNRDTAP